jgi:hypothetical protein
MLKANRKSTVQECDPPGVGKAARMLNIEQMTTNKINYQLRIKNE